VDDVSDPTAPPIPRWECFIGDPPLITPGDESRMVKRSTNAGTAAAMLAAQRGCIAQITAIEDHADSGTVVASDEMMALIGVGG
jgi:hypothetical protein